MELDLGNNAYDILNDWHPNAAKEELTAQLTKQVLVEKEQLPKLLSREDLKERWEMNSRQRALLSRLWTGFFDTARCRYTEKFSKPRFQPKMA